MALKQLPRMLFGKQRLYLPGPTPSQRVLRLLDQAHTPPPVYTTMPALSNVALTYDFCLHATAADFLEAAEHALLADQERRSNLILAHALERASWEASRIGLGAAAATIGRTPRERSQAWWTRRRSGNLPVPQVGRDFWMTCWTVQTPVATNSHATPAPMRLPTLDFAISVLSSDPVFVFTPHAAASLSPNFLIPRARPLVRQLSQCMPLERMSRIFALYPVAEIIANEWTAHTSTARAPESQCNVFSTFCTVATFSGVQPLPEGHRVGPANAAHASRVARMYYDFEKEMVLHPVSHDLARHKVEQMIQQGQLWVYEYPVLNAERTRVEYYDVCAIAALTRHTHTVAALSTIYTIPQARGQRIGERLVGRICSNVFAMNKSAVLFVSQGNMAAGNLLGRIGFYGMGSRAALGETAETWREIGFVGGVRGSGSW